MISIARYGVWVCATVLAVGGPIASPAAGQTAPAAPVRPSATELDAKLNWERAALIAVQDGGRYKTLDSFAREWMSALTGKQSLAGLSPLASLFEWTFNSDAYADEPIVYIRDRGLRLHFGAHLEHAARVRVVQTGYMTPREFNSPQVERVLRELTPRFDMRSAMNRANQTAAAVRVIPYMLRVVPRPVSDPDEPWHAPPELFANLSLLTELGISRERAAAIARRETPIPGITPDQAFEIIKLWSIDLRAGWLERDAARVQRALDTLAERLPTLATAGVYPDLSQRKAEVRYYALGKMYPGIMMYMFGAVVAVFALVTGWRWASVGSQLLILAALCYHGYALALRWYILGRIPVANMFEALTASALTGIVLVILIELLRTATRAGMFAWFLRTFRYFALIDFALAAALGYVTWTWMISLRLDEVWLNYSAAGLAAVVGFLGRYLVPAVLATFPRLFYQRTVSPIFLIAAHVTGCFALITASFLLPGGGTLTSIRRILDDVMLRIHTVLIICSYALIFLAGVIALAYLFGYYLYTATARSAEAGLKAACGGALMLFFALSPIDALAAYVPASSASGIQHAAWAPPVFGALAIAFALLAVAGGRLPLGASGRYYALALGSVFALSTLTLAVMPFGFTRGLGYTMLIGGLVWSAGNLIAMYWPAVARAAVPVGGGAATLQLAGGGRGLLLESRPVLAGGMPGDEKNTALPAWLNHFDWSHLIILNLVFIFLFVGTVLGAVWADYSWGRPWGWDPKEVFAMNTWLIYAILIHVRFVTRARGLWTAWLSVAGCLMMAFNWCFVNFFIVGMHSYA